MVHKRWRPFIYITCSAILFGASAPLAKVLVADIAPVALAGLLYLGAFVGLLFFRSVSRVFAPRAPKKAEPLRRADLPHLAGAIASGGVIAPILLLTGLMSVTGYASSLLLNLEGVATALIAWLAFRETVGRRVWIALALMTAAGALLTLDLSGGGTTALGAGLIALAMVFWGLDNNLTRQISERDPRQIALLKGLVAGSVSLGLAFLLGQAPALGVETLTALLLGALSYGASLVLFILALSELGSARTGALYSLGPFVGAAISIPLLSESPNLLILPAGALMALGAYLLLTERHAHPHVHERIVHTHVHGPDEGHQHEHALGMEGAHEHEHTHEKVHHAHEHLPDAEHRHEH
jgi:drug/metabolite transporter (DMT)-like permease